MELKDIIFGKRAVFEAIENDIQIDKIFMDRDSQYMDNIKRKIIDKKIKISFVPIEKLNKLSKNNHQGIVASISPVKTLDIKDLENSIEKKATKFLILDNITDTKNFGAIVRSAECLGLDGVIISKTGSSPINGDTIKSSSGAIFNLPIYKLDHIKDAMFLLKEKEIEIIGADEKSNSSIFDFKFSKKTAIVMGSEGKGISKSILNLCDKTLKIPMKGKIDSLNVSVACGIILAELSRGKL
ncbi:MAG: 23S rRNA (guanosine(2251)-2'-O)-methyltransferase RlmB [Flavobacteriaceae bacterium]|nr:23S rRNA (guanosine(2251)-2'-O)-methyltransferase RlmB [Flavobacteriaceae bacterium]